MHDVFLLIADAAAAVFILLRMCKFLLYAKAAALLGRCADFLAYLYV